MDTTTDTVSVPIADVEIPARIAVDGNGLPLVISHIGTMQKWNGQIWEPIEGDSISFDSSGSGVNNAAFSFNSVKAEPLWESFSKSQNTFKSHWSR